MKILPIGESGGKLWVYRSVYDRRVFNYTEYYPDRRKVKRRKNDRT